jgi:hypothetical protein
VGCPMSGLKVSLFRLRERGTPFLIKINWNEVIKSLSGAVFVTGEPPALHQLRDRQNIVASTSSLLLF